MIKILWVSKHKILEIEKTELKNLFGDIVIENYKNSFDSAEEIVDYFKKNKFNEMVVVAPLSVIAKIIELGVKPLYAKMEIVNNDNYDIQVNKRRYKFVKFVRINNIFIEFKDIKE